MHIVSFKIIFSMKVGYVYVWQMFFSIKRGCEIIFKFVSILF